MVSWLYSGNIVVEVLKRTVSMERKDFPRNLHGVHHPCPGPAGVPEKLSRV